MIRRWTIPLVAVLALGAWGATSCATPVREDPPSHLAEEDGTGGGGDANATDTTSSATTVTGGGGVVQMSSNASAATSTGGSPGDSTSSSTTTTSANDSGSGGGTSSTSDSGSGGGGGTGGTSSTTVGASTTGAGTITGDLPWSDDFEMETENGPASNWNPMESDGGWTVVMTNGSLAYATLAEASNRNLAWAGDPTWTNMRLTVDVRMSSGGDDTRIYFGVRAAVRAGSSNKLDYYFGYLRGDGIVRIGKYLDGSTSSENETTSSGVDVTAWNTVSVTVDGDAVSMEVNGDEFSTNTLSGRDSGFVALGVDKGEAEFDNVMVTAP